MFAYLSFTGHLNDLMKGVIDLKDVVFYLSVITFGLFLSHQAVASERCPLPAVSLSEVLATSDVPGGVINVLTGRTAEIAPWLASHMDVDGIDLTGVADAELARNLEIEAAGNLKRVRRRGLEDLLAAPALDRMTTFLETKTVWHPMGI